MSYAEAFLLSSVPFIMASSHDETDIICCVGKFTKKDCFKENYAKCTVKNLIVLDELPVDDQRVIKLRVGSDYIKTICLHHQCVYFTYFVSTTFQTKHCCDPLKKHRKNNIRLIPGLKLCKWCLEFLESEDFNQSHQTTPTIEDLNSSGALYFDSPKEKVITPRRVISALSNASIISPIVELDRSSSERRLRICSDVLDTVKRNILQSEDLSSFNANDYSELLNSVREKVNSTNNRSNQLSLLTLAPSSWTHEQISAYFGVSKYQAAQANDLKIQSGILAHPPKKKNGHCLSDEEKLRIIGFYTSDEYSRQLPGMKNVKSVKQPCGKRLKIQKRLLLINIKELYA
ncbi:hypothetical protein DAPPUDRAFT_333848, partial [Daphnia pulex]